MPEGSQDKRIRKLKLEKGKEIEKESKKKENKEMLFHRKY